MPFCIPSRCYDSLIIFYIIILNLLNMCPNCGKHSRCGCYSCKKRKGKPTLRTFKFVRGDFVKCPYCRKTFHFDNWESYGFTFSKFIPVIEKEGEKGICPNCGTELEPIWNLCNKCY